jgi:AcrR family transcriptional regulator
MVPHTATEGLRADMVVHAGTRALGRPSPCRPAGSAADVTPGSGRGGRLEVARQERRTAEAIVNSGLRLFEERGFDQTTIDQIAEAAEISRRTFFRYFTDKEELFFAEDERLLDVIQDTLDHAPAGESVVDIAHRATRALAAESVADPERRVARERLIAATPALLARRMAKNLRWEQAIAERLLQRGFTEWEALLLPKFALGCFQAAYERWVRDPSQDLQTLVD